MDIFIFSSSKHIICIAFTFQDTSEVAFSAGLTKMLKLSHTERVVYDRIYTNIGNAYNSQTGTFVCPQAGIYVFQFHSLAHQVS